jgi:tetratricopeptide (TPR) repeat protein
MLSDKKLFHFTPGASRVAPASADRTGVSARSRRSRSLLVVGALAVGLWGLCHHPQVQEWRLSRLSLPALQKERGSRMDDPVLLYYLGLRLNQQGRYREADPLLRQAVGLDPESARCRDAWAQALLGSGLTTAAFGELREFAGVHPNSPLAHLLLGKFYVTQRSMARAREELRRTIELDPASGEAWAYLSGAEGELGDQEAAREAARKAVELRPDNAGDHLVYAALLAQIGRGTEARSEFKEAIRLEPRRSELHREYSHWLQQHGTEPADAALAETEAHQAVELAPQNAGAQAALGQALLRNGRDADAVAPLTLATALAPDDPASPLALAQVCHRLNRAPEAATWQRVYLERQAYAAEQHRLWEALRIDPRSNVTHTKMAHLLGRHGDVEGAVRHHAMALHCALDAPPALVAAAADLTAGGHAAAALPLAQRAVGIAAANPAAHEALADALLGSGQTEPAVVEYRKAAGWMPERAPLYRKKLAQAAAEKAAHPSPAARAYHLARAREQEQIGPRTFTAEVEALAQQAAVLEPTNPLYLRYLFQVQISRKETEAALVTGARLLTLLPNDASAHALMAVLMVETANRPEEFAAVERHLQAAQSDPASAATWRYGQGLLALRRKQGAEAVRELKQALALNPTADLIWYKLALAQSLNGDAAGSEQTMAVYRQRQEAKRRQVDALGDIAQHPERPEGYRRAARVFESQGLKDQAQALLQEGRRRSGGNAAP